jgi:hypothetical protein
VSAAFEYPIDVTYDDSRWAARAACLATAGRAGQAGAMARAAEQRRRDRLKGDGSAMEQLSEV